MPIIKILNFIILNNFGRDSPSIYEFLEESGFNSEEMSF